MEESSNSPHRSQKREIHSLTIEQIKQLLETEQEQDLKTVLAIAITTGMRQGELLGLHWQDIDRQNEILHVRRIISGNEEREATGTARTLALPTMALLALQEHQRGQKQEQGETWQDCGLVFADASGQHYRSSKLWQRCRAPFAAIGLPHLRFHDLRYSAVVSFIAMGVNVAVIQTILGLRHQSTVLKTLTPITLSMQKEAMQRWDRFLAKEGKDLQKCEEYIRLFAQ